MNDKDMSASYVELSGKAYSMFVDAVASANQRALDYTKSVWEIASRPYASTAPESAMRENFDRTNQVVALTIAELQTGSEKAAELAQQTFAHGVKFQETLVQTTRGLVDTGVSNLNFVKDTATKSFDDLAKRMDDVQARATSQISSI
ncbi:MAG: hypothetical protein IAI50_04860 [Candidatus Eremiobacteraeota bacterium]|nr:hypothetical protein [Candidatus Eremiobacteraeota bacterium]